MFIEHQPCLGTIRLFAHLIFSNTNKVSSAIPVVQVTKLSPREINQLTQSHPAGGELEISVQPAWFQSLTLSSVLYYHHITLTFLLLALLLVK